MKKLLNGMLASRLNNLGTVPDFILINEAKQIIQELALLGLARSRFFERAAFHGGTALRIFYGLNRFSEDLDFALKTPDKDYKLSNLFDPLLRELTSWGLETEVQYKDKADQTVQKVFLKESSLGAVLLLTNPLHHQQKLRVKIELDVNPPSGASFEQQLHQFPIDFYVVTHDFSSMFAGKLHALLCRQYTKGRDWFDFCFYVARKAPINLNFLYHSLLQVGQFKESITNTIDHKWVLDALNKRIESLDLQKAKEDVRPFLADSSEIDIWSKDYFLEKVRKMRVYLN